MVSSTSAAVRYILGTRKLPQGVLQLRLHVRPGSGQSREGIQTITDDTIELCVAARAKRGQANQAVIKILSEVLDVPKSRLHLSHGTKSRDKVVTLVKIEGDGLAYASTILSLLQKSIIN